MDCNFNKVIGIIDYDNQLLWWEGLASWMDLAGDCGMKLKRSEALTPDKLVNWIIWIIYINFIFFDFHALNSINWKIREISVYFEGYRQT